jgi:acyl-CoA thioester hydrolase
MSPTLGENSGFVVRNIDADFVSTATLGDILEVKTELLILKNSSLILRQEIWKEETKIFSMKIKLVYLHEKKPSRIPQSFKEIFTSF